MNSPLTIRAARREHGAQTAELALWVPLLIFALVSLLQMVLVVQAQRAAEQAASATAGRVLSGSTSAEAEAELTDAVEGLEDARIGPRSVQVTVRPRRVAPWLPIGDRTARSPLGEGTSR